MFISLRKRSRIKEDALTGQNCEISDLVNLTEEILDLQEQFRDRNVHYFEIKDQKDLKDLGLLFLARAKKSSGKVNVNNLQRYALKTAILVKAI